MKVAIMQPYIFPYIGYFQLINSVHKFVIGDDVNFIKGGWINRNNMLENGAAKLFSIPLYKASPNKLINQIEFIGETDNDSKFLKRIRNIYSKAKNYEEIYSLINSIMIYKEPNLALFIKNSLEKICDYLDIKTTILVSSEMEKNMLLKKQNKVIEMCKKLNATTYINAIGGTKLYTKEDFMAEGIELKFLKTKKIEYTQYKNYNFVPNLSIIDVMMFNSKTEVKKLLNEYELIEN